MVAWLGVACRQCRSAAERVSSQAHDAPIWLQFAACCLPALCLPGPCAAIPLSSHSLDSAGLQNVGRLVVVTPTPQRGQRKHPPQHARRSQGVPAGRQRCMRACMGRGQAQVLQQCSIPLSAPVLQRSSSKELYLPKRGHFRLLQDHMNPTNQPEGSQLERHAKPMLLKQRHAAAAPSSAAPCGSP
jgi:hypothetical protein